jgi:hypothetical protein
MDDQRDVAVVALALIAATCLAIFFLQVAEPTSALFALLFPRA